MFFKRGGEDSVLTVISRRFPTKRRQELGQLLAEEVQSRTDFEKNNLQHKNLFNTYS